MLHKLVTLGIEARWPRFFDKEILDSAKIASSTIQRSRFVVDLAIIAAQRTMNKSPEPMYRFAWINGTDMKGWQMLVSRHLQINCSQGWEAMEAIHKLVLDLVYLKTCLAEDAR